MSLNNSCMYLAVQPVEGPDFIAYISFKKKDYSESMETYYKVVNNADFFGISDFWDMAAKQNRKVRQCVKYVDNLLKFMDDNDLIIYRYTPIEYRIWLKSKGLYDKSKDYSSVNYDRYFKKFVCDHVFENIKRWVRKNGTEGARDILSQFDAYDGYWYFKAYFDVSVTLYNEYITDQAEFAYGQNYEAQMMD